MSQRKCVAPSFFWENVRLAVIFSFMPTKILNLRSLLQTYNNPSCDYNLVLASNFFLPLSNNLICFPFPSFFLFKKICIQNH
jgi:hypothetical protein